MRAIPSKVRRKLHWISQKVSGWLTIAQTVVARFRPPNKTELANGGDQVVDFESEDSCKLNVRRPKPAPYSIRDQLVYDRFS